MNLVNRIIQDPTCVIEGSVEELNEAVGTLSTWIMSEECKERNVDYAWVRKCEDAKHAILKYLNQKSDNS